MAEMTPYVPKTDDEIKKLALDIIGNLVFTSDQVSNPDEVPMVFMLMMFMPPETVDRLVEQEASLFYEEYAKANSRGVNGYPTFFSCSWISKADHERLLTKLKALRTAMEAA